jgi:hypothetical protein
MKASGNKIFLLRMRFSGYLGNQLFSDTLSSGRVKKKRLSLKKVSA